MAILDDVAGKIIKEQELVIGPMAWSEARKVPGMSVLDEKAGSVNVGSNGMGVIDQLVARYERLFGRAAAEVCRDAAHALISNMSPAEIPASLR